MTTSSTAAAPDTSPNDIWTPRKQLRGSSLLLLGKLPTKGINFLTQVLTAHYLTKGDFGAFAYALSVAALVQTFVAFGLNRAVTRYIPIYHERGEIEKILGTLVLVATTVLSLSAAAVAVLFLGEGMIQQHVEPQTLALLAILIFLAPLQALDDTLVGMLAVFGAARDILVRKHVIAPLLNLAVILGVIAAGLSVQGLAYGMLLGSAVGIAIYLGVLRRIMYAQGVLGSAERRPLRVPLREVMTFTIPLLTTDLLYVSIATMDVVMLGHFHDATRVADLRVVLPLALINQIVMNSFGILFTPMASRLFARGDHQGINAYYWKTAACVAVFSLPVFLMTFSCAAPLVRLIYGERYADSGWILALLAVGYYFNAALGFNGATLKVYGRLRYMVVINLSGIFAGFVANLLLIPRYGAIGAAAATCGTLVIHNLLKQLGLRRATAIDPLDRSYLGVYGWIALAVVVSALPQLVVPTHPAVSVLVAAVVSLAVLRRTERTLSLSETYPEILRIPLMRRLLARQALKE
jgi:O-antigen/teichoic acid export membrane protein